MSNTWKRVFIALCLLLGTVGGFAFYFWQRATRLPDWYTANSTVEPINPQIVAQEAEAQRQVVTKKVDQVVRQANAGESVAVELDQKELNGLVQSEVNRSVKKLKVAKAVEGVNTSIRNETLETGAVINLNKLSETSLSSQEKEALTRVLQAFPALGDRPIYVGIEGKPRVENGQLVLDESTRIRLGELSFSLPEVAERLGISPAELQERINVNLQLGDMQVKDVELQGDRLLIRGAAANE